MLLITVNQHLEKTNKTDEFNAGFITRPFDTKAFASNLSLSDSIQRLWSYSNMYSREFSVKLTLQVTHASEIELLQSVTCKKGNIEILEDLPQSPKEFYDSLVPHRHT